MILVVLTVAFGVAIGYLRGGRLRRLADVEFAGLWLLAVACGLQGGLLLATVAVGDGSTIGPWLLAGSQVAVLGFIWRNRHLVGMPLIFTGFALNVLVITANGAMPVSPAALRAVTAAPVDVAAGKHRLLTDGDALPWLADVIPVPLVRSVVSVGDILLVVGVVLLMVSLMVGGSRGRPGRRLSRPRPASPPSLPTPPADLSTASTEAAGPHG